MHLSLSKVVDRPATEVLVKGRGVGEHPYHASDAVDRPITDVLVVVVVVVVFVVVGRGDREACHDHQFHDRLHAGLRFERVRAGP